MLRGIEGNAKFRRFVIHATYTRVADKQIKFRYLSKGLATYNEYGDIYIFENFVVILRRPFKDVHLGYAPLVIYTESTDEQFNFPVPAYVPQRVLFKTIVKGEVEIRFEMNSFLFSQGLVEIAVKGLTEEELLALEKMKGWIS